MNQEEAKTKIQALIDTYEKSVSSGQFKKYTEEETKKDFILPLFEALGWEVYGKEVSAEEHIRSSGRVDYGFYLNERPKFYLEAKKLSADLHREDFARQSIRYAWNRGVTWAVLTDFESIKVFNAQVIDKDLGDKLFFEISHTQYLERFDQLWLLSKEAFGKDLLDKEAEKFGKKLQKISITALLYKDLDKCREILTKTFSVCNPNVPKDLIDEGVQKLLDRLIFLRVAEDRGVEPNTLTVLMREAEAGKHGTQLFKSMVAKFRELGETYDSELFSPHPFEEWDDFGDAVKDVIRILYGKKGYYEYDFKVMPADVLGGVYESYLGHKLSQSKKGLSLGKGDNKRKEQGIYYTPAYIVDYIVKKALQPVLDKCRTVEDIKKIRVLDPACGSGSFLVKALEVIHDKYREFGNTAGVFTKLTILNENIYGVDLDPQAVEIARLNLLINSLDERVKLPLLADNIKNGNSLISGTDEELKKYFGPSFRDKKPFNWHEEFPDAFKKGGFDVIIGNPPYIFARGHSFEKTEKDYYYKNFELQQYQINTYLLFIERAYHLLKDGGSFGFIVPNNWLTINSFAKLREFLLKNTADLKIINAVDTVFGQASVDTCVLVFGKGKPTTVETGELRDGEFSLFAKRKPEEFYGNDFVINISHSNKDGVLSDKFKRCVPLGEIADVKSGLVAYEVGKGVPPQTPEMKDSRVYHSTKKEDESWRPYLDGVDVRRYALHWSGEYIKYGKNLAAPRKEDLFTKGRVLVRQIPSPYPRCINAVYTDEGFVNDRNSNNILNSKNGYDLKYILGIINSRLLSYWFLKTFNKFQRKIFPQFKVNELARFPICPADKQQQKLIIDLVDKILNLNKELQETAENSDKWKQLSTEIERTDKKIDEEVYKLYDLTEDEIKIIENQTK